MDAIYAGIDAATPKLIMAASSLVTKSLAALFEGLSQSGEMVIINESDTTFILEQQSSAHGQSVSTARRIPAAVQTRHGVVPLATIVGCSVANPTFVIPAIFGPQYAISFKPENDKEAKPLTFAMGVPINGENTLTVTNDSSAKAAKDVYSSKGVTSGQQTFKVNGFNILASTSSPSGNKPKFIVVISHN